MTLCSVLIPARNEIFLQRTIDDVLDNARGDTEVIAVCDGYKPDLRERKGLRIIHNETAIGQRQATNQAARESNAKFIMKLDAHCSVDEGFDVKLASHCEYDWTVLPAMRHLEAFRWVCSCGQTFPQGPEPNCHEVTMEVLWRVRPGRVTEFMFIDPELRARYFDGPAKREYPWTDHYAKHAAGDICDVMVGMGPGWFMHRDRYWELGGMDESHGSWGQMGVEIALKAWLSGGRHVVNRTTWFSHLFRTKPGFSWPYKITDAEIDKARAYSKDLWLNDKWPMAKRPFRWVIDKFAPVPGWKAQKPAAVGDALTVLYYTDSQLAEPLASACRKHLQQSASGYPIVSVSQKPLDFGRNICVGELGRSFENIYKQILAGLREVSTPYVALAEHDCLYTPEHWQHRSPGKFAYNMNRWAMHTDMGMFSWRNRGCLSQLIVPTALLKKNIEGRLLVGWKKVKRHTREWFEPGLNDSALGMATEPMEKFKTTTPNIDINHGRNFSGKKLLGDTTARSIPGWGTSMDIERTLGMQRPVRAFLKTYFKPTAEIWEQRYAMSPSAKRGLFGSYAELVSDVLGGKTPDAKTTSYYAYMVQRRYRRPEKRFIGHVQLIQEIQKNGILYPLEFYRRGKTWRLFDGFHRLVIAHVLGIETIPCRVFRSRGHLIKIGSIHSQPRTAPRYLETLAGQQMAKLGEEATNKHSWHGYMSQYDREISQWKNSRIKILEFGVFGGGSLLLWHDAFPKAQVIGVDRRSGVGKLARGLDRVTILQGMQADDAFLTAQVKPLGPFHIVIDDASHRPADQLGTFKSIWPHVVPGGVYVIEDLFVDYKYRKADLSTIEFLKSIVDRIYTDLTVSQVHFDRDICFIRKSVEQPGV